MTSTNRVDIRIIEEGWYEELLQNGGSYARLYGKLQHQYFK